MKTVKNIADTDLVIGIEGSDYTFPAGTVVACEDNIGDFIKEQFPLFEVERLSVGKEGDEVPRVESKPSKVYNKVAQDQTGLGTDVHFTQHPKDDTNPAPEETQNGVDRDGVEWVGQGIEMDDLK